MVSQWSTVGGLSCPRNDPDTGPPVTKVGAVCTTNEEDDEVETFSHTQTQPSITDEMIVERIGDSITHEQRLQVLRLLRKYPMLIAENPKKPSFTSKVKHRIDTGDAAPIKQKPYRTSRREDEVIATEVRAMLEGQVI